MANRWRALHSAFIQLKRWNHWVRNVMRHHLNYVQWTQITGIFWSTLYLCLCLAPSSLAAVLCAQSNDLWAGAKPTPAAAWLQLAVNAKSQMQKVHNVQGVAEGAGRVGVVVTGEPTLSLSLSLALAVSGCVDNDLCKVANLISCAPKNAARISTATVKVLPRPVLPPPCPPSLCQCCHCELIFKWWH